MSNTMDGMNTAQVHHYSNCARIPSLHAAEDVAPEIADGVALSGDTESSSSPLSPKSQQRTWDKGAKRAIIDSMLEGAMPEKERERIYRRLEGYPAQALELISDYGAKIADRPLGLFSRDSGMYFPGSKKIMLARGATIDYFIDHPRISAFLESRKPLAIIAGIGAALGAALAFTALPAALLAAGAGGIALAPFSLMFSNLVRERSIKDPLTHETAHALDAALGARERCRDLPVDPRVSFDYTTKDIPFSMKSPEVIECFLACREGKEGSRFVTEYAAKDPIEYFAESMRAYVNVDRVGENAQRSDLLKKDPSMCRIIEKLLGEISGGSHD
jgi:hypothetical protein